MKYTDVPVDRAKHARIKCELELRGLNLAALAKELGVGASAVSSVSLGKSRSERIEKHLASAVGQTVLELFPERYPQNSDIEEEPQMQS
ncbi:hypothetical protein So717_07930 [Roseobacter cerasinus]|uniref:Ner winged helix-turn-helix DNA-binding domain-containing protein n=1 Tax=Roseobacter cerasinus TaxID=2602289 RepID=A0A640VNN6_9RHOB|nr:hypothetical protein So717_07930 [Roseobacter cerasinus]